MGNRWHDHPLTKKMMLWAKRGRSYYAPRSTYGRCEADSLNSKPEIIHVEQSQADLDCRKVHPTLHAEKVLEQYSWTSAQS